MPHFHAILVAGRLLQHAHEPSGVIPIAAFRIFLAEIEQLDRDSATELKLMGERLIDERNHFGYPTKLGTNY